MPLKLYRFMAIGCVTWGFTAGYACKDGVRQISAGICSRKRDNTTEVGGRGGVGFDTVSVNHGIVSPHGPPICAASVPSVLPTTCTCPPINHTYDCCLPARTFRAQLIFRMVEARQEMLLSIHRPDSSGQTFWPVGQTQCPCGDCGGLCWPCELIASQLKGHFLGNYVPDLAFVWKISFAFLQHLHSTLMNVGGRRVGLLYFLLRWRGWQEHAVRGVSQLRGAPMSCNQSSCDLLTNVDAQSSVGPEKANID